jgi:hypothetical protein
MSTGTTFHLRSYELNCGARPLGNGNFEPTLVVCSKTWPSRPRTIAVPRGQWTTEAAAIEAAHAQGLEWVANFG